MVAATRSIVAVARSTGAVRRSNDAVARSANAVRRSTVAVTRSTVAGARSTIAVTRSTIAGARSTIAVRRSTGAVGNVVIMGDTTGLVLIYWVVGARPYWYCVGNCGDEEPTLFNNNRE